MGGSFGQVLKDYRIKAGMTLDDIAYSLEEKGYIPRSQSTLCRWENNKTKRLPSPEDVQNLEEVFGIERGLLLEAAGYL